MPCDTILEVTCDFAKCDPSILEASLKALGYTPLDYGNSIVFESEHGRATIGYGELSLRDGSQEQAQELATKVRSEFNKQAVRASAKAHGWNVKATKDGKLRLTRRKA